MTKNKKIIYQSEIRYYSPSYPYRIVVEKKNSKKNEIVIGNYSVRNSEGITHGLKVTLKDLEKIIENLKRE